MFARKKSPQESVAYFELREALQEQGCPVCHLLSKRSVAALDSILYEQVTDPTTRERLRETQGLCNWHAWMLTRIPMGQSGIAILYEDLLGRQIETLRSLRLRAPRRSFWQRIKRRYDRAKPAACVTRYGAVSACPICGALRGGDEANYLRALLDFLSVAEFAQSFQESFGLCLPHLGQALAGQRYHANLLRLRDLEVHKFEALRQELREFIRKCDYRFATEPMGGERTSWQRVIELFVGKPEVFGPDRQTR
jgi:hypothetical protein